MASNAVRRGMRVLTLPSVLFTSGLAGHVAGDGPTPPGWVLVALFALTVVAVAPFTGVALSPARVVALLIGGQAVLHTALLLLGGTAVTATTTMHGAATGGATGSAPASSHLMMHHGAEATHGPVVSLMSGGHLVMLLAHLAAAIVVGVWLAAGERALWTLLALTARPLVDAWRTVSAVVGGVGALVVGCPRLQIGWGLRRVVLGQVWTAGVVSRRGPPGAGLPEPDAYAAALTV